MYPRCRLTCEPALLLLVARRCYRCSSVVVVVASDWCMDFYFCYHCRWCCWSGNFYRRCWTADALMNQRMLFNLLLPLLLQCAALASNSPAPAAATSDADAICPYIYGRCFKYQQIIIILPYTLVFSRVDAGNTRVRSNISSPHLLTLYRPSINSPSSRHSPSINPPSSNTLECSTGLWLFNAALATSNDKLKTDFLNGTNNLLSNALTNLCS